MEDRAAESEMVRLKSPIGKVPIRKVGLEVSPVKS